MSVIIEATNITANVFSSAIVETYKAGGNPALVLLAMLGIFAILSSAIKNSSRVLATLFIICIAAPFLFIEYLWKKYKGQSRKEDDV